MDIDFTFLRCFCGVVIGMALAEVFVKAIKLIKTSPKRHSRKKKKSH